MRNLKKDGEEDINMDEMTCPSCGNEVEYGFYMDGENMIMWVICESCGYTQE